MGVFLKTVYPVLKPISVVYFWLLDFIFNVINAFRPRESLPPIDNDLIYLPATEAAEKIRKREITSTELVAAYISRIKAVNPVINAMVEDNFDGALTEAAKVDAYLEGIDKASDEFRNLPKTKPLLGVPVSIKECFALEGFHHTSGLVARKNIVANTDAEAVKLVKAAGAIITGITNVSEACFWVESVNNVYGRTKNAYDNRRAAGGSSGGEGALIGAGASVIGLGSDLAGSVRIPAQFNGIYALKPTESAITDKGHHPCFTRGYPAKMGNMGPMCRYAKDLSVFFRVLTGHENAENRFQLSKPVTMSKLRFFYMEDLRSFAIEPLQADMRAQVRATVKYFETKYDKTISKVDFAKLHHALEIYLTSLSETKEAPLTSLVKNMPSNFSLALEVLKLFIGKSDHTMATLFTVGLDKIPPMEKPTRAMVEASRDKLRREIIELLKDDGILIFPSWSTVASYHYKALGAYWSMMYTGIWNALRLPAVVCPMGLDKNGIPLSVQLIAGPDNERLLIAAAEDIESGFGGWVPPGSH